MVLSVIGHVAWMLNPRSPGSRSNPIVNTYSQFQTCGRTEAPRKGVACSSPRLLKAARPPGPIVRPLFVTEQMIVDQPADLTVRLHTNGLHRLNLHFIRVVGISSVRPVHGCSNRIYLLPEQRDTDRHPSGVLSAFGSASKSILNARAELERTGETEEIHTKSSR